MIILDFAPGTHGHFLEYVVNRYIFLTPVSGSNIFQSSGACHPINLDIAYQKSKTVHLGHYSAFDQLYPNQTKEIIFIKHTRKFDFILLVNIFHRCHPDAILTSDFNIEDIKKLHSDMMFVSSRVDWELRNDWYAKLQERHHAFLQTEKKNKSTLPTFDFDFGSFFSLVDFLKELEKLAQFLNMTFKFDSSLTDLWHEFIQRNIGFKMYNHCNYILEKIYANQSCEIQLDWKEQAYINSVLSNTFRMHDGILFSTDPYPSNTKSIYQLLENHIQTFDLRF